MLTLRPYQEKARQAVYRHLRTRDDSPCVVIPTAGGKTPVMASICRDAVCQWNGRVLVLAHVRELLEQTAEKLRAASPDLQFGVYSAGLGRRDTDAPVIVAGIQSVFQRACDLGRFDLVLIDESHMIPMDGEGRYRTFLEEARIVNPGVRIVGFTATPFRMGSGPICTPDGILNHVCYEVGVGRLIRNGFLCPLISKKGIASPDTRKLHLCGGEFVTSETEDLMDGVVGAACREIVDLSAARRSCLIFAAGTRHARNVAQAIESLGHECGLVLGDTPGQKRDDILGRFRERKLKFLVNVGVLTTGFDAPCIDCVALLRPTMSPGLFCQMVGRGFRLHPGKDDCLVLDFGGNILRHGPVDAIRPVAPRRGGGEVPVKECPACTALVATGYRTCPHCGHMFPEPERGRHSSRASQADVLSQSFTDTWHDVLDVRYHIHWKRIAADGPRSMRVEYQVSLDSWIREFICLEHKGYARQRAVDWWRKRSPDPVPDSAERAVEIAGAGGLARTLAIKVRSAEGEKYDRIVAYRIGPMPEPVEEFEDAELVEVPF